jgi:DNA-binding transcriptional LysR family regulator
MLTIPHLEALVAIAELGSFRAASQRLNVTQPTISLRIKQLEESLHVNLFDRSSYRPTLTSEGKAILDLARRTLELTREMNALGRRSHRIEGKIRLGVCDTFAITCLPALLNQLEQRTPGIEVALDIDYSANLDRGLHEGKIDTAFLTSPTAGAGIAFEQVADIELAWVANRRLGLSEGPCLPEQLASVTIITNPEPSHLFATTNEWFRRAGVRPSRLATCSSLLHIERLACAGVGAAILPLAILQDEFMNGSLSTIDTVPAGGAHKLFIARRHAAASLVSDLVDEIAREVLAASALSQPAQSLMDQPERPRITVPAR